MLEITMHYLLSIYLFNLIDRQRMLVKTTSLHRNFVAIGYGHIQIYTVFQNYIHKNENLNEHINCIVYYLYAICNM